MKFVTFFLLFVIVSSGVYCASDWVRPYDVFNRITLNDSTIYNWDDLVYNDSNITASLYWARLGNLLYPVNAGDNIQTTGDVYTRKILSSDNVESGATVVGKSVVATGNTYAGEVESGHANGVIYILGSGATSQARFFSYDGSAYYDFSLGAQKTISPWGGAFGAYFDASSGFVGIHDDTPSQVLDVGGNANIQGDLTIGGNLNTNFENLSVTGSNPHIIFTDTANSTVPPSAVIDTNFKYNDGGSYTNFGQIVIGKTNNISGNTQGYMSFFGKKTGTAKAEAMRIEGMNLGIGVSDPDSRVEIKGEYTTASTYALNVRNSADSVLMNVSNTGVVNIPNDIIVGDDIVSVSGDIEANIGHVYSASLNVDSGTLTANVVSNKVGINTPATTRNELTVNGMIDATDWLVTGASAFTAPAGSYMRGYYYTAADVGRMYAISGSTYKGMAFGSWNAGSPPLTLTADAKLGVNVPYNTIPYTLTVGGNAGIQGNTTIDDNAIINDNLEVKKNLTSANIKILYNGILEMGNLTIIELDYNNIHFVPNENSNITWNNNVTQGQTPFYVWSGYPNDSIKKQLVLDIGGHDKDTAYWKGLTNYQFNGTILSDNIYVGGTSYAGYEIGTSGQIYSGDYIVAMGGLHVGGTSDPSTDNLLVDGTTNLNKGLISNEAGGSTTDYDTRFESDTKTNAFFLDASAETISLGVPTSGTEISASTYLKAPQIKVSKKTKDPTSVPDGETIIWSSDGTQKGDVGDLLVVVNISGSMSWGTLFDYSTGNSTW